MRSVFLKTAAVIAALATAAALASCSESGNKTDINTTAVMNTAVEKAAGNGAETKIIDVTNDKGNVIATSVVTIGKNGSADSANGDNKVASAANDANNKTNATKKTNATNATKKTNGTIGTNKTNSTNKTNATRKTNATVATKKPNSAGGGNDPTVIDKF